MSEPFKIGLVGAGAISAGAYTGGVIDFLVFALDEWQKAKDAGKDVPLHDVELSVFSGASAGAMTAAIAAIYLGSDQPSIQNPDDAAKFPGQNKLYDSWVEKIDVRNLLETKDLTGDKPTVVSLLDSTVLDDIAKAGMRAIPRASRRKYVADPFQLMLTVTNTRGVPYSFEVEGVRKPSYCMSMHADYMHFAFGVSPDTADATRIPIPWNAIGGDAPALFLLKDAALASGAFPVGLAPRVLKHVIPGGTMPDNYNGRLWDIPTPFSSNPHRCATSQKVSPSWPPLQPYYSYEFLAVDGGVMNNEPFELARKALAGDDLHNPQKGDEAKRAVLLVDPFPNTSDFKGDYAANKDILSSIFGVVGALKNQARFKPEEIALALNENVYSRFMIAPERTEDQNHPIACGSLGGFGGFLKKSFREHDYFLGRRNTQRFLAHHFTLPENNPLFQSWTEAHKVKYCVKTDAGAPELQNGLRFLPIIPLVDGACERCYKPVWPTYTEENLAELEQKLQTRVDTVLDTLVDQFFAKKFRPIRWIAKFIAGRKKGDMVNFALNTVQKDLLDMGILGYVPDLQE